MYFMVFGNFCSLVLEKFWRNCLIIFYESCTLNCNQVKSAYEDKQTFIRIKIIRILRLRFAEM